MHARVTGQPEKPILVPARALGKRGMQ